MTTTDVELVGVADGPSRWVDELGLKLATFTHKPKNNKCLMYHVPLEYRGDYKPKDLDNYDPSFKYRCDAYGKVLCGSVTKAGLSCAKRAKNRSPYCETHGGDLHPFDKIKKEARSTDDMSRAEQFRKGLLTLEDLEDDELAACAFRTKDGRLIASKNMPREMMQEFQRALFKRADVEMKKHTVDAVRATAEIMKSTAVEPEVRLKAAQFLIERNLGKTPQVIAFQSAAPWEEVFDDIVHQRTEAIKQPSIESAIDAEVIDDGFSAEQLTPNQNGNKTTDAPEDDGRTDTKATTNSRNGIPLVPVPQTISIQDSKKSRNPAILTQEHEIKDFQYDLNDHVTQVNAARRKRFIARALQQTQVDQPAIPLQRITERRFTGDLIKWIGPIH